MQSSKNALKAPQSRNAQPRSPLPDTANNFNFLMQSIDRQKYTNYLNSTQTNLNLSIDKENYQDNEGRYSIKVKPVRSQRNDLGLARSGFVGVGGSFLGDGEMKERGKEREKDRDEQKLIESLLYKIKKYLAITEGMLQNPMKVEEKLRKNGINTACELIEIINSCEQAGIPKRSRENSTNCSLNSTGNLVLGSNKSLSSSYHFPNGLSNSPEDPRNFIRKIQNLEQQKLQLQSLISQHERANIKMFIKLNEGQSEQIQKYKKLLSSLFQKYKQLEKLVKSQSEKSKSLQLVIDGLKNKKQCSRLCEVNMVQMRKKIVGFQELIHEQNQYLSKALEEIEEMKIKIEIYQKMEAQYGRLLSEMQRSKPVSKSISISSENSEQPFAGIMIKNNSKANGNGNDDGILRMLVMQAGFIDSVLHK